MPSTYELASGRVILGIAREDVELARLTFNVYSSRDSRDVDENRDAMAMAIEAALQSRTVRERVAACLARESGQDVPAVEPVQSAS